MDLVLFTVMHHFGRRQRWQAALQFFSSLMEVHPGAAVYVSAAQVRGGRQKTTMEGRRMHQVNTRASCVYVAAVHREDTPLDNLFNFYIKFTIVASFICLMAPLMCLSVLDRNLTRHRVLCICALR